MYLGSRIVYVVSRNSTMFAIHFFLWWLCSLFLFFLL